EFNDSKWETIEIPGKLNLPKGGSFFWLRSTITIPKELVGQQLWFASGKTLAAYDLYVNGEYLGSRGRLPPEYYLQQNINDLVFLPEALLFSSELHIALRCYYSSVQTDLTGFTLANKAEATWLQGIPVFFNMRMYVILAAICLFLGIYFIVQFLGNNEDSASIWYALSLLLIAIYFFDMGSEVVLVPLLQNAIARSAMAASLGFLLLFFIKFFNTQGYTVMKRVVPISSIALTVAYILNYRSNVAITTIFNLSLLPVFAVIFFTLRTAIKACRRKNPDAYPILVGLIIGLGFGIHDIVYQVLGKNPFAWLQGITFFMLNLSVFVAMSAKAARAQKENCNFITETAEQHTRMSRIVTSVQNMMQETTDVTKTLTVAVKDISDEIGLSNSNAHEISGLIHLQRQGLDSASSAINHLLRSIQNVNQELAAEAISIESSAKDTATLIEGFAAVSTMLRDTAVFTDRLSDITSQGNEHMAKLSHTMLTVQDLSTQIRSVVDALNDFAERTNLLAMNASIEAAHAGSSGVGFAVIAQEIKKLAAASGERAGKINELVKAIEQAIQDTAHHSDTVRDSLQEIATGATETATHIHEASAHTEQQQRSGTAIANEAAKLSESAQRMIHEVGSQETFSTEVHESMKALTASVSSTEDAATAILERNTNLETQSAQVRHATDRSQAVSAELQRLLANP
ncbi:MAG TPA: hypothetical protein GXZ47_04425, partial [Treponema sp.]|nr:hypothetical protein [Treponema sp.]